MYGVYIIYIMCSTYCPYSQTIYGFIYINTWCYCSIILYTLCVWPFVLFRFSDTKFVPRGENQKVFRENAVRVFTASQVTFPEKKNKCVANTKASYFCRFSLFIKTPNTAWPRDGQTNLSDFVKPCLFSPNNVITRERILL